jgi:hypothetical protein
VLRALLAAVRRFLSRRAARRLLAQRLPRGVREQRLALPAPPGEPPPGEFWTAPAGARKPSRLFRLAALPPPPQRLEVVRPRKLRLDAEFRPPSGLDPLRTLEPRPLRLRPRTPLPRPPLHRLDGRKFRLDPRTQSPVNQGILPLAPNDPSYRWLSPAFRRRFIDLPWMAQERIGFLGPLHAEWFVIWWDQSVKENLGPRAPKEWDRPDEIDWAMDNCREQMLIRRDVVKDEQGPPPGELSAPELGHPLVAWDPRPLPELVPPKEWVDTADPPALAPPPPMERAPREAYLRWRTLMESLQER